MVLYALVALAGFGVLGMVRTPNPAREQWELLGREAGNDPGLGVIQKGTGNCLGMNQSGTGDGLNWDWDWTNLGQGRLVWD